jgi:DGQHR domain-containing protein
MPEAKVKKKGGVSVPAIVLHEDPFVYMAALPGRWLLDRSTPSWRIADPDRGFQRIVKEQRAKEIARTVLDTHRTFPNAIILATKAKEYPLRGSVLDIPRAAKFLVVDGQHRLWAQHYSRVEGTYPCILHMGRSEQQMAELFLEINDNQRRVPSSLRWDLVRLVRNDDKSTVLTSDIVYELATRKESPFFSVGIDLTGERKPEFIKQGSLAPEIRTLVNRHVRHIKGDPAGLEEYVGLLIRFFVAVRSLDPDGWGDTGSTFYKARVLRALLRVLADLVTSAESLEELTTSKLRDAVEKIDRDTLSEEAVRRMQGSAGVQDLYEQMKAQVFRGRGK